MPPPDFGSNLLELFGRTASRRGSAPCLWAKREGTYRPWSWQRVANEVQVLARALRARGVAPGDRVLLVAENRPEWAIADLAIMAAGGVTVPAYTTNTIENNEYLLNHSGAVAAVVSTDRLARRLLPAVARAPALKLVVSMEPLAEAAQLNVPVLTWAEALALGEQSAAPSPDPATTLTRDDLACFIYTSGTGGNPKGVMLTHGNILANVAGAHARARDARSRRRARCSCRSCRCPMPTNTPRGSSCPWRWARRSTTPTVWKRWPATSSKCARPSSPAYPACTR